MNRINNLVQYDKNKRTTVVYPRVVDNVLFKLIPGHFQMPKFLLANKSGVYYYVSNENLGELKYFIEEGYVSENLINGKSIEDLDDDSNPIILYYEYKPVGGIKLAHS